MAQKIVDSVMPEHEDGRMQMEQHIQETVNKLPDLERWIAGRGALALPEELSKTDEVRDNSDMLSSDQEHIDIRNLQTEIMNHAEREDNEEGEINGEDTEEEGSGEELDEEDDIDYADKEGAALPDIAEAEQLLLRGSAFHKLSANLQRFLLPTTFAAITRTIMSIPTDCVWFSSEDDLSMTNRAKALIEDTTEESWNWWPLQPRIRKLERDQTRMHWRCVSALIASA